jgi:hypothetical protein
MTSKQKNKALKGIERFILLCLLLISYTAYLTLKYDFITGGISSLLTWSFFVLCTPVADAGFLLDFPLRLILGIRMVISEIVVWALAITLNLIALNYYPQYYEVTMLTRILHKVITTPYPYWGLIIICCIGTFLSIILGDELLDFLSLKDRASRRRYMRKMGLTIAMLTAAILFYYELVKEIELEI